jgi:signal transduction histidine kinase/ActR/RegA family two-component response regulator
MFEVTVSPVTDARQQVTHLVHVMRDLSERKKLEAELRQAQKMQAVGTLAGGIAHDFNNILMVIQCYTEMLKNKVGQPDEDLEAILKATRRGSTLSTQLLVFSRKGAAVTRKQPVNLNELIRNVIKMLENGLPKMVSLHLHLPGNLRSLLANPEQIEQVLMNLAVNAAHAMPAGGKLSFETRNFTPTPDFLRSHPDLKPGDYVQLTVADTGHGMDRPTLERIYEPFFTTKKVGEGTGLGLAVVFGIVQDHAGTITCESEVGLGTTFTICLPAASQPGNGPRPATDGRTSQPRGTETILVVDDEMSICLLLGRYLKTLGYTVITAHDGEAALEKYKTADCRPHAVILDLGMPKMSGWKCLEELRKIDPRVKVMIGTGYGGDNLETEVRNRGAAGLLTKPYQLADFGKTLRNILDTTAPAN